MSTLPPSLIHTDKYQFIDSSTGRTLLLRGVNLSGASKAPLDEPSQKHEGFWENAENGGKSFIGRPLELEDADVHLKRLRGWGFNMLRFPVTWEVLEHEGPGKYDYEFIDYTIKVLRKCKEHGFKVFLDPHQDTWSRFSGGSGAPYWTLPACGMNPRNFTASQSALLHSEYPPDPSQFPAMIWSTNYNRLVNQTIFTLFFAGKDFAPKCILDGVNIQEWLQRHFIGAFGVLADKIKEEASDLLDECIIGWDSINEPSEGLCGYPDLRTIPTHYTNSLTMGTKPTPEQSFKLGMGQPQTVDNWSFGSFGPKKEKSVTIDPKGVKIWLDPDSEQESRWGWRRDSQWELGTCVWALHGVWNVLTGEVLKPDYFASPISNPERRVAFVIDYWRPHFVDYLARIRKSHPKAIAFFNPPVFLQPPPIDQDDQDILNGRACYSPHYYDGLTLITRHWNWFNADALGLLRGKYSNKLGALRIGESAIRKSMQDQLAILRTDVEVVGPYPTLMGEIGIPFDLDKKKAYKDGDYREHQKALDSSMNAADGKSCLNWTIWNYCPDNGHVWGDGWNLEDLSLWSADDVKEEERTGEKRGAATTAGYPPMATRSDITLLKNPKHDDALVSTLSVATLNPGDNATPSGSKMDLISAAAYRVKEPSNSSIPSSDDPYTLIISGARAIRAFCRPYPVLTVGQPSFMSLDIKNASWELRVKVSASDRSKRDGVDEEEIATEIFLPMVHFGSEKILKQGQQEDEEEDDEVLPTPITEQPTMTFSITNSQASTLLSPSSAPIPIPPNALEVQVTPSVGRYELHGQYLKWYYPLPSEDEDDLEYTIKVKRVGGAMKGFMGSGIGDGKDQQTLCEWVGSVVNGGCRVM